MGAQGKDGAEGVDGDMFGNAAASQDVVRMQGEIDKLWKAQMKFVGQFNKLTAAYDEVARMQEKIINLQTEKQRLINEIDRLVDFVNHQDTVIKRLVSDVSDLWVYDEEHKERIDRLWDDCEEVANWIKRTEAGIG